MPDKEYMDPYYSTGRYNIHGMKNNNFNLRFILKKVKNVDDLRSNFKFDQVLNFSWNNCMNCSEKLTDSNKKMSNIISQKEECARDKKIDLIVCCEKCAIVLYKNMVLIKNNSTSSVNNINGRVSCIKSIINSPKVKYLSTIVDYSPEKIKYAENFFNKTVYIFSNFKSCSEIIRCVVLEIDKMAEILNVCPDFNVSTSEPGYLVHLLNSADKYVYWLLPTNLQSLKLEISCTFQNAVGNGFKKRLLNKSNQCNARKNKIIHVFGEIKGAFGFNVDNIFVRYALELPPGWTIVDPNQLSGVTQGSSDRMGFHALGHLFELVLEVEDSVTHSFLPTLHFEVLSLSAWRKTKCEGFTKTTLPQTAGHSSYSMQAFRLYNSPLRSFFLPFSECFMKQQSTFSKGHYINKITPINLQHSKTESTGKILVEFYIVFEKNMQDNPGHCCSVERIQSTTPLVKSVKSTIESYISVRKRVQEALKIK